MKEIPHRRFRFTLRTLLLLALVVGCTSGFVLNHRYQPTRQAALIAKLDLEDVGYEPVFSSDSMYHRFLEFILGDQQRVISISMKWNDERDLNRLSQLGDLKILHLFGEYDRSAGGLPVPLSSRALNLDVLKKFRNLEAIEISGLKVTDASALGDLNRLKSLVLRECWDINFASISELTSLSNLQIEKSQFCKDLLKAAKNVTELSLTGIDKDMDNLSALDSLKNLTKLKIKECSRLKSLEGLGKKQYLKNISIYECASLTSIEGLNESPNLEVATIRLANLERLDGLEGLRKLRLIELISCNNLIDITGIEAADGLVQLSIEYSDKLTSLNGIEDHPILETINLRGCSNLSDIDSIRSLRSLRFINVVGCEKLIPEKIEEASGQTSAIFVESMDHVFWTSSGRQSPQGTWYDVGDRPSDL